MLVARWWWRLPSERAYMQFLQRLGARGDLLNKRCLHYQDVRLGLREWRRRYYWHYRARQLALTLILGLLWPVLTASALTPQACTEATAQYVRRGIVEHTIISNGQPLRIPAGAAAGWSCVSQAEADAAFAAAAAQIGVAP